MSRHSNHCQHSPAWCADCRTWYCQKCDKDLASGNVGPVYPIQPIYPLPYYEPVRPWGPWIVTCTTNTGDGDVIAGSPTARLSAGSHHHAEAHQ